MVQRNRTRIDFVEEFQRMTDEYNAGSLNVERFFARLQAFATRLNEEERRGIAENLTEEELVIFDLLTKPDIALTKAESAEVKKVAKTLLEKLKREKLVLDWRKQQTTRAMVRVTIEDALEPVASRLLKIALRREVRHGVSALLRVLSRPGTEHLPVSRGSK